MRHDSIETLTDLERIQDSFHYGENDNWLAILICLICIFSYL